MYHTLYRAAWLESVAKAKEAEEEEKKAREEERKSKKNNSIRSGTAGEALDRIRSLNSSDLEDLAEEMGFDE